ncbi:unnamed protein product [Paramecium octaurelia]|uniref:WD40-repeat-containing domain n=1 Tax=Paramecium octaurelia TaxID=43137 RepID=A0A8S1X7N3_PAROT|nr:unnamed protein product [Paramecium octaurelia]
MVIGFKKGKLQLKKKDLLQWHTIQEIQLTSQIRDIHLNLEENQIVVEVQPKIIIIEKKNQRNEETWVVVQEINIDESFRNVIFVNDKTFAVKLCNIRKWMLFQQKNQCQFAHKRNIIIYGANEDLLYILEKYHEGQIRNPDKSNCFLNLEFQIDGTYLSLKDKQQYIQQFYPSGLQNDNYIQGEYFFGQDFRENQIIVGKYKQLFIEYKIVKSITFPQNEHYQIMTIKSDNQILVLGFNNQIKVFKLEDSTVTLIQVLNHHTDNVDSLLFQKTENSFISGSSDKSIKIWSWDQVGKIYQCQQILQSLVKPKSTGFRWSELNLIMGIKKILLVVKIEFLF